MKKFLFLVLVLAVFVSLSGCGKKEQTFTEIQEPYSMDEMSAVQVAPVAEVAPKTEQTTVAVKPIAAGLESSTPLTVVTKPTVQEIQTALKNAGYYTGAIDGKSGPLTKKATEDFQQANNLQVDGKVGTKTWAVLSRHLNPAPATTGKKR